MNINELTIGDLQQLKKILNPTGIVTHVDANDEHPYEIGAVYLLRLATVYDTGRVVRVTKNEIELTEAAWIPDTGRFADAVKQAEFSEVEPFPDGSVIVGRGAVIDACKINKAQRSQK